MIKTRCTKFSELIEKEFQASGHIWSMGWELGRGMYTGHLHSSRAIWLWPHQLKRRPCQTCLSVELDSRSERRLLLSGHSLPSHTLPSSLSFPGNQNVEGIFEAASK